MDPKRRYAGAVRSKQVRTTQEDVLDAGRARCPAPRRGRRGARSQMAGMLGGSVGFFLTLLFASPAIAEPSAEERAVARSFFERARTAQEAGEWQACERHLNDALRIVETPGLLFHRAFCREQQLRWVEALVDYERAGERLATGAEGQDVAELLPSAVARLKREIPRLRLVLEEVPDETALYLDGESRSVELLGQPIPVDPGNRHVEVKAPGHQPFSRDVKLVPRETRNLVVQLSPIQPPATEPAPVSPRAPMPHPDAPNEEPWLSARGYVLLSETAVALTGLGLGFWFLSDAEESERQRSALSSRIDDPSACSRPDTEDAQCRELREAADDVREKRTLSAVSFAVAGVGAASVLTTWLVWPSNDQPSMALTLSPFTKGMGARFSGTF